MPATNISLKLFCSLYTCDVMFRDSSNGNRAKLLPIWCLREGHLLCCLKLNESRNTGNKKCGVKALLCKSYERIKKLL